MKLKEYRNEHNITQPQMAEKIGVSLIMITRYENKKRTPSAKIIKKIYDVTCGKVTPNDWFELKKPPEMINT